MPTPSNHAWKVDLIPWDHQSPSHIARLKQQREACGWMSEEVPSWVKVARMFYWIVFSDAAPGRDKLLADHIKKYPKEADPLADTAQTVREVSRAPKEKPFFPIGHIALDIHTPEQDEKIGLPRSGVVWIKHVYLSYALHSGGFGKGAVQKAEQLAACAPLNAEFIALDTIAKENQKDEDYLKVNYDERGLARPKITNEEWYISLGYTVFSKKDELFRYVHPNGVVQMLQIIYLMKKVS